jgi:transcriptional regulator with XRE-family HTH domain
MGRLITIRTNVNNSSTSPAVPRRRLRAELRQARQQAGLTQEAVAAEMDWSLSKIIRIETGAVGISTNDLGALLRLYQVDSAERTNELVALARAARQKSWWSKYRGSVSPAYFQYLEYEADASAIRQYEALLIPGLLQTEEYATAAISQYRGHHPGRSQESAGRFSQKMIKTRVELRMTRQQLLQQPASPRLFFILDEAVIQRTIGEERIGPAEITRLITMANRPGVTIQVVPFSVGMYVGMAENYTIFSFPNAADQDVLYFEGAQNSIFSYDESGEIAAYRQLYEEQSKAALSPEGSLEYLTNIAADIALL